MEIYKIDDTELLHSVRYVAYGYNINGPDKRGFDDKEVIWPGNLTTSHRPRLVYKNDVTHEEFTLFFTFVDTDTENLETDPTKRYWNL
jgi:hypothetical protein